MAQSSFYGDTPNYATDYPTQNDSNTQPVNGNPAAPSSFYPNGGVFEKLADSDAVLAQMNALEAQAAADAAAAATSATGAASSATAASGSATAAATSAANAATSATNAGNSATAAAASKTAADTDATNAGNSATAAAGSASAASTSATSASGSATSASGSASAASTSATSASGSASAASTSATNAASSASAAATSAANAAAAVTAAAGTATPIVDGTAAVGTSTKWAHEDHVHPTDTSRAPLASPAFTGTPTASTATAGTNTTQLATTAFVLANAVLKRTSAITLHVSPTGSNSNDGLTVGTALQTLQAAATLAYSTYYTCNQGSITIDGGGNTFQEFVQVFFPLNGGGTLIFTNFTWQPANSGYCLQFGDGALVGLTNITLSSAGVTSPVGFVIGHQEGVLDVNTGVAVTPTVTISGDVFATDGLTHFNINNGITINAGSIGGFLYRSHWQGAAAVGKASWNIQGAHVYNGSPSIGRFAWSTLCSSMVFSSTVTHTGTVTAGVSLVNQNGVIQNQGAALPGGTPTPTTGGQYTTTATA